MCAFIILTFCEEMLWEIPVGVLKGLKVTTAHENKTYYSFRSVPYVKAVTGINKFEVLKFYIYTTNKIFNFIFIHLGSYYNGK